MRQYDTELSDYQCWSLVLVDHHRDLLFLYVQDYLGLLLDKYMYKMNTLTRSSYLTNNQSPVVIHQIEYFSIHNWVFLNIHFGGIFENMPNYVLTCRQN